MDGLGFRAQGLCRMEGLGFRAWCLFRGFGLGSRALDIHQLHGNLNYLLTSITC